MIKIIFSFSLFLMTHFVMAGIYGPFITTEGDNHFKLVGASFSKSKKNVTLYDWNNQTFIATYTAFSTVKSSPFYRKPSRSQTNPESLWDMRIDEIGQKMLLNKYLNFEPVTLKRCLTKDLCAGDVLYHEKDDRTFIVSALDYFYVLSSMATNSDAPIEFYINDVFRKKRILANVRSIKDLKKITLHVGCRNGVCVDDELNYLNRDKQFIRTKIVGFTEDSFVTIRSLYKKLYRDHGQFPVEVILDNSCQSLHATEKELKLATALKESSEACKAKSTDCFEVKTQMIETPSGRCLFYSNHRGYEAVEF